MKLKPEFSKKIEEAKGGILLYINSKGNPSIGVLGELSMAQLLALNAILPREILKIVGIDIEQIPD